MGGLDDNLGGMNRRKLLRSLTVLTAGTTGVASIPISVSAGRKHTAIAQLNGDSRQSIISQSLIDANEKSAVGEIVGVDEVGARTYRSSYRGDEWHTVSVEIDTDEDGKFRLLWSDHDLMQPIVVPKEVVDHGSRADSEGDLTVDQVEGGPQASVPIGLPVCGTWDDMPNPACIAELAYLYASEIKDCSICAHHLSKIDGKKRYDVAVKIIRSLPSCVPCIANIVKKGFDQGVPCDLCVPESEIWYGGDTVEL